MGTKTINLLLILCLPTINIGINVRRLYNGFPIMKVDFGCWTIPRYTHHLWHLLAKSCFHLEEFMLLFSFQTNILTSARQLFVKNPQRGEVHRFGTEFEVSLIGCTSHEGLRKDIKMVAIEDCLSIGVFIKHCSPFVRCIG